MFKTKTVILSVIFFLLLVLMHSGCWYVEPDFEQQGCSLNGAYWEVEE